MNENLVEIKSDEHFIVDMMYASLKNNMTGVAVYEEMGLGNRAFVHKDLWEKLQNVVPYLKAHSLKMKICDAYRPPLAHKRMKEVIPQPGFFASNPDASKHCHATAVDVCLCYPDGRELKYPTKVDAFDAQYAKEVQNGEMAAFFEHLKKAAHGYNEGIDAEALKNREELLDLMTGVGLGTCSFEWWHYELENGKDENHPMIDY